MPGSSLYRALQSSLSSPLARGRYALGRHVGRIRRARPEDPLVGPFRNVDPHTASLAVYFRGPASELFNMLNPESPGAISVLARSYSRACVDAKPPPPPLFLCARANVSVCVTRTCIYPRVRVRARLCT